MKRFQLVLVSAVLACIGGSVCAQTKSKDPASESSSYADQVNMLDAQAQILQRQATLRSLLQQAASTDVGAGLPRILAIFGFEHALVTKLAMPDGSTRVFRENQWVNDYVKITAINDGGVIVAIKNKKNPVQLAFAPTANAINRPQLAPTSLPDSLLPPAPYVPMPTIEPPGKGASSTSPIAVIPTR